MAGCMYEDYSERLFAHYVGGAWRAPFSTDARPVVTQQGQTLGQVISAGPRDVARALAVATGAAPDQRRDFGAIIAAQAEELAEGLAAQGCRPPVTAVLQLAARLLSPEPALTSLPAVITVSPRSDFPAFGLLLSRALVGGALYCPVLCDAVFATQLACCAARAQLPAGAFNLLHCPSTEARLSLRAPDQAPS